MSFAVAIDGPAASGKGTIARAVAAHFGFLHLDTGLLYRAVGRQMLDGVPALEAAEALTPDRLNDPSLRSAEVAQAASKAAAIPAVRAALVDFQRAFARREGGAVLDGRDIGTVICPDAEAKLFVIAAPEIRAQRRCAELRGKGAEVSEAEVLEDLRVRDERDMTRPDAPLKAARDAVTLDTTDMSIEDAVAQAINLIDRLRAKA
ncbi:(d)CMP kinase [Sagittula salina]|uniref:Cytidylate kinase n=1 Tax=Sagittula salina TaxID=2820268 RepID=A0A940S0Z9_9RHOB|nr:(d)CMP kinase [Sagittula salina]MBP0483618.1 (d)CMP kinase [Sagittula salina]